MLPAELGGPPRARRTENERSLAAEVRLALREHLKPSPAAGGPERAGQSLPPQRRAQARGNDRDVVTGTTDYWFERDWGRRSGDRGRAPAKAARNRTNRSQGVPSRGRVDRPTDHPTESAPNGGKRSDESKQRRRLPPARSSDLRCSPRKRCKASDGGGGSGSSLASRRDRGIPPVRIQKSCDVLAGDPRHRALVQCDALIERRDHLPRRNRGQALPSSCSTSSPWVAGTRIPTRGPRRRSTTDMTSWAKEAKATRSSRYIGLIAIPGGGGLGWTAPRFRAWLLRSDGPGRDFSSEPARLIEL